MHIEHKAGDKMFVDFTGKHLSLVDPDSGAIREVEVFVAVLGASQRTYVEATKTQKKHDWIEANHLRPYAAQNAIDLSFWMFDTYKKVHGMPSYT